MKVWYFIIVLLTLMVMPVENSIADNTDLIKAAATGNAAIVLKLLERGEPVDTRDQKGKTALIAASQHGHADVVKLLLDKGAAVDARTTRGSTALYYAAQNHHIDTLKLLQARGADVNSVNLNQFSPLSVAIVNSDEEVVRLLLDYGADPNVNPTGSPLLTEALSRSSAEIFQVLVEKGADVNASREVYGDTPLMIAVAMQRMEAVKLLLSRGADIRAKDADDKSVLHWFLCNTFSEEENTQLLKLLLNSGADHDSQAGSLVGFKDGSTPLICAVRRGYENSVNILLAARPNLNRKDHDGHSALYYAVAENNLAMVDVLLKHGANPALEPELERKARLTTEIGERLLRALQPALEMKSLQCPQYDKVNAKSAKTTQRYQPLTTLDPLKSQDFPLAKVEVIEAIPSVGHEFSLSPDGKWLVVQEDHNKSPQLRSQRLVVYDIAKQQSYFFSPKDNFRVAEDGWLADSSRYVLLDNLLDNYGTREQKQRIIDVASGQPKLHTLAEPLPQSVQLFAGGDRCPWRNNKGQVVLSRPDRDGLERAWSADGKVVYSLQGIGNDEYYLIEQRGTDLKKLVRHSAKGLRDQLLAQYHAELQSVLLANKQAEFEKFKAMLEEMPLPKLSASRFILSPNDRYLYYRIAQEAGHGFFGLPDSNVVVDLDSTPVQVWFIGKHLWGAPQWHPNGHDLYFIDQNATARSDPNFPPMRQPGRWRLSVVRLP